MSLLLAGSICPHARSLLAPVEELLWGSFSRYSVRLTRYLYHPSGSLCPYPRCYRPAQGEYVVELGIMHGTDVALWPYRACLGTCSLLRWSCCRLLGVLRHALAFCAVGTEASRSSDCGKASEQRMRGNRPENAMCEKADDERMRWLRIGRLCHVPATVCTCFLFETPWLFSLFLLPIRVPVRTSLPLDGILSWTKLFTTLFY